MRAGSGGDGGGRVTQTGNMRGRVSIADLRKSAAAAARRLSVAMRAKISATRASLIVGVRWNFRSNKNYAAASETKSDFAQ